jgi:competence protein ComEA
MTRIVSAALLTLVLSVCAAGAQHTAVRTAAAQAPSPAALNLNTATVAQLESLPGIGRATAERIVEYRQKSGGFKKIEELMNVRGVGEKSFLKLKPLITVSAPRTERASQN